MYNSAPITHQEPLSHHEFAVSFVNTVKDKYSYWEANEMLKTIRESLIEARLSEIEQLEKKISAIRESLDALPKN